MVSFDSAQEIEVFPPDIVTGFVSSCSCVGCRNEFLYSVIGPFLSWLTFETSSVSVLGKELLPKFQVSYEIVSFNYVYDKIFF